MLPGLTDHDKSSADDTVESRSASPRSLLFVPGDRPERFAKAAASGADGIIVDLEDAVSPENKDAARGHVAAWLHDHPSVVRINGADTQWFDDDIDAVRSMRRPVMIPKVESAEQLSSVVARIPHCPIVALVETASGVANAAAICAVDGVAAAAFGSVDLGAELGVDPADRHALAYARSSLIIAAAANRLPPPMDGVCVDVSDAASVLAEARYAAALGFGGKLCIHPRQVAPIHEAFAPSNDEVIWAQRVVEAGKRSGTAVLDGKMIDRPVMLRARRILDRARLSAD